MTLGIYKRLSEEETRQLISEVQKGDEDALEKLVAHNIGLLKAIVRRWNKPVQEQEDLFQIGAIGLIKAAQKFELDRELKFSTYAYPVVNGEIYKHLRDKDNLFKVPRDINLAASKIHRQELYDTPPEEVKDILELDSVETAIYSLRLAKNFTRSIDEPFSLGKGDREPVTLADQLPDDVNNDWFEVIAIRELFKVLDEREKKIITLRYYRDRTQHEIAPEIGVSQVQVSRIEKKALAKLKKHLIDA